MVQLGQLVEIWVQQDYLQVLGTQTAGLAFGGFVPSPFLLNNTEKYDGSTWTPSGNLGYS
jgi:hypothetical protein